MIRDYFDTNMTPDHAKRDHAEFSPSSLKYVALCAGYEGKNESSSASDMGTRIHEALEVRDPSALHNEDELSIYEQIIEMENEFMQNFEPVAEELNEIQVTMSLSGAETWGTCDRFLILESRNRAVMADYKTGISIIDPPEKNWQAKAYVTGAFQRYPEINEITFVFYVPQHHASLHHTFTRDDLPVLVDELTKVVKAGEATRPRWADGTIDIEHCRPTQYCRFCKHEDHCPALGGLVIEVAKKIDSSIPDIGASDIDDPKRLSELFNIAKIVENWADSIKAKTLAAAKDGVQLDGLTLRSLGRTRSITDNATLIQVAEKFGVAAEDLLVQATFPLGKISKLVSANAPKKEKKGVEQNFVDACEEAGIVALSDERFTIASR